MLHQYHGTIYEGRSGGDAARNHQQIQPLAADGGLGHGMEEIQLSYWRHEHLCHLMEDEIPNSFIPKLDDFPGRWHPSGFMVFHVARHPYLGFIRLHVWPQDLRQRQERGSGKLGEVHEGKIHNGDIHDHDWHVSGLNIAGYRDIIYSVKDEGYDLSDEEVAERGLFRIFRAVYVPESDDKLATDGECVSATIQEERELLAGDLHEVRLGEYHAPTIPDDEFAATLAINSYRVSHGGPRILISGTTDPIDAVRQDVTLDEKMLAKEQLFRAL